MKSVFFLVSTLALPLGCNSSAGPSVTTPEVDGQDAASKAVELYDANSDGSLSKDELAKCPPLLHYLANYDSSGDGQLTEAEIAGRLDKIAGSTAAFIDFACAVSVNRRPINGAQVKLRPVEFIGDALPTAEGTTDEMGVAHPSTAADRLPPDLAGAALVFPGLYHVEVTHPKTQLPARYNAETELGVEVDPSSRSGTSAQFDLKPN